MQNNSVEILVGVGGSIAAYKACDVVSDLKKRGAGVTVLMTKSAAKFASPLALKVLSGRPVGTDLFEEPAEWGVGHVTLAKRAQAFLIVGATADLLAKLDLGLADDFVTAAALVAKCPLILAPAMNTAMWVHPATKGHVKSLKKKGAIVIEPVEGLLACGDEGAGKLAEPKLLAEAAFKAAGTASGGRVSATGPLAGKKVLVTAGPTREALDPVRHISNPSTGKMGFALAEAARDAGAKVTLVSGPVELDNPAGIKTIRVTTALEMLKAVGKEFAACDALIAAAAVSDFRPAKAAFQKKKKGAKAETLELVANPDILLEMSKKKGKRVLIGFAAETQKLEGFAKAKLKAKKLDLVVANPVGKGRGFGTEDNTATLVSPDGRVRPLGTMTKLALAGLVVAELAALLPGKK